MRPLALALGVALSIAASAAAQEQPFLGTAAPPFDLPTLDGDNVSLESCRGKLVVLHFGAGW